MGPEGGGGDVNGEREEERGGRGAMGLKRSVEKGR